MPKIPKVTRWTRFTNFLRGLLLYNTVYWSRASDGLRPPKATREERRSKRPVRDLSIIKPRENPRAKFEDVEGGVVGSVGVAATSIQPVNPAPVASAPLTLTPSSEGGEHRRKRKKRRKHRTGGLNPMDVFAGTAGGAIARLLKKKT